MDNNIPWYIKNDPTNTILAYQPKGQAVGMMESAIPGQVEVIAHFDFALTNEQAIEFYKAWKYSRTLRARFIRWLRHFLQI